MKERIFIRFASGVMICKPASRVLFSPGELVSDRLKRGGLALMEVASSPFHFLNFLVSLAGEHGSFSGFIKHGWDIFCAGGLLETPVPNFDADFFPVAELGGDHRCPLVFPANGTRHAAIVFSVEVDPPVTAGDEAIISFFASSDAMDVVTGMNLPIDIGDDDFMMPAGLSFASNPIRNIIGGITPGLPGQFNPGPSNALSGSDAIVNLLGLPSVQFTETPTKIFDLALNVDLSTVAGTYVISIDDNGVPPLNISSFFAVSNAGAVVQASAPASGFGSVTVVAIPEPSSVLALTAVVCLASLRLRQRLSKSHLQQDGDGFPPA